MTTRTPRPTASSDDKPTAPANPTTPPPDVCAVSAALLPLPPIYVALPPTQTNTSLIWRVAIWAARRAGRRATGHLAGGADKSHAAAARRGWSMAGTTAEAPADLRYSKHHHPWVRRAAGASLAHVTGPATPGQQLAAPMNTRAHRDLAGT